MDYLEGLNPVQQKAVTHINGPSLVIAGAGSGKTRVLTFRIAHILSKGVPAHKILALTFTNKAAKEMKERISALVGEEKAKRLWMGTFHSIFAKILRKEADHIGYSSNYTIYDTIDAKSLIRSLLKELKLSPDQYKEGDVLHRISMAKNNLVTPDYYENSPYYQQDIAAKKFEISKIYRMYANRCKKAGAMDFDDLLLQTNILFRDKKDVLAEYQDKFEYILVDEYQDTNSSQYLILKKLAAKHRNICVVGDDSQSIYSFRGAKIENILSFQKDYPDNLVFKLEQNYRSTQTIVNAANSVIAYNEKRIPKELFSESDTGTKIKIVQNYTDADEGQYVANAIHDSVYRDHFDYKEYAILYRTNAQSRIFEEALRRKNIPYKIFGGMSFYQRKEIKDVLAYFRLIVNKNDDESLKRIINYPRRGIGDTTIDKIDEFARSQTMTLWDALNLANRMNGLNKGAISKIIEFVNLINEFTAKSKLIDAFELAKEVTSKAGILKELYEDKSIEGLGRYENVQELLNAISEYANQQDRIKEELTLENFLQEVALLTDADNEKPEERNKVVLMTIHASKGLEFKSVFIVGTEEGLFPSSMSSSSQQEIEEERRLFYVAVTRAEVNLTISFAQTRFRWGQLVESKPSRFIKEIDEKYIDFPAKSTNQNLFVEDDTNENEFTNFASKYHNDFSKKVNDKIANQMKKTVSKLNFDPMPSNKKLVKMNDSPKIPANLNSDDGEDVSEILKVGMQVEHQRFGYGKVIALDGELPNIKATIMFQKAGEKHLLLKFAKLKIIGKN